MSQTNHYCTHCIIAVIYRLPLKPPHKKFVVSFCLFDKGQYLSWYVVIIHQALLDITEKKKKKLAADIRATYQLK